MSNTDDTVPSHARRQARLLHNQQIRERNRAKSKNRASSPHGNGGTRVMSPTGFDINKEENDLLNFINDNPILQSCLYDIDMMPEQLIRGNMLFQQRTGRKSKAWCDMLIIASHFRDALRKP